MHIKGIAENMLKSILLRHLMRSASGHSRVHGRPSKQPYVGSRRLRPANFPFNILAAKLHIAFIMILDGRGVLFGLADDVNIACSPEVLGEIVVKLLDLAMSECGLTTQATKGKVYVQPSAIAAWTSYLDENPRNPDPLSFSIRTRLPRRTHHAE